MVDTDDTRCTTDDEQRTMPWVWHKLPTGELKIGTLKKKNNITKRPLTLSLSHPSLFSTYSADMKN